MRLSPLDIKKQEFSRTIRRGYDPDEVHAFIDMLASQWEDLLAEQRRTEDKVRELKAKMEHYEKVEEALQEALRTARESSQQTLENARQEAALILQKAEADAEDVGRDALRRRDELQLEADELIRRRDEIVARLRAFLQAETEMLERYEDRNAAIGVPPRREEAAHEPAPVAAMAPAEAEEALDPTPEAEAPTDDASADEPLDTEEREEVLEEVAAEEPAVAEIEIEVIDATPEIEVEVIEEKKPPKKSKGRKNKKAAAPVEDEPSPSFFQEDVPAHFADDEEPLSFRFFEANDEEGDPAKFLDENEETTQFAPVPADAPRKNGRMPRSEDRAPADSTWIVRPVVSSAKPTEATDSGPTSPSDEIDKIRRILSDLD